MSCTNNLVVLHILRHLIIQYGLGYPQHIKISVSCFVYVILWNLRLFGTLAYQYLLVLLLYVISDHCSSKWCHVDDKYTFCQCPRNCYFVSEFCSKSNLLYELNACGSFPIFLYNDGRLGLPLVEKRAVLPVLNPFNPGFGTRSTNPGLKGPSFSPGFSPGTKCPPLVPVGNTNRG